MNKRFSNPVAETFDDEDSGGGGGSMFDNDDSLSPKGKSHVACSLGAARLYQTRPVKLVAIQLQKLHAPARRPTDRPG